jgi:hypothetical protein
MSLTLTNIPKIMQAKGWVKGALLMQYWFDGNATTAPAYTLPDTSTITMEWVLRFGRAKVVYDQLVTDQIWTNAAAQGQITRMLRKKGLLVAGPEPILNFVYEAYDDRKEFLCRAPKAKQRSRH